MRKCSARVVNFYGKCHEDNVNSENTKKMRKYIFIDEKDYKAASR